MKTVAVVASSLACLSTSIVLAADPIDLATYWETPPTTAQTLEKGDYTLSADTSIGVQLIAKPGTTFDFSEDGKTFSVVGYGDAQSGISFVDMTNTWKGGVWDLGNAGINFAYARANGGLPGDLTGHRVILDGVEFKNVKNISGLVGYGNDARLVLTNGTKISMNNDFVAGSSNADSDFYLDILDGSQVLMSGSALRNEYYSGQKNSSRTTITVAGKGSKVQGQSTGLYIGNNSPNATLNVLDGGLVDLYYMCLGGGSNGHDNKIYVDNAALTNDYWSYVGSQSSYSAKSYNNALEIVNGSDVVMSGHYSAGIHVGNYEPDNYVLVSNSTLHVDKIYLGKNDARATNNYLRVAGPNAKLHLYLDGLHTANPWKPFGVGQHCWIQIEDGAQVGYAIAEPYSSEYWEWCFSFLGSTNETVRVKDANSLFKIYDMTLNGCSNRLEAVDGGTLQFQAFNSYADSAYDCTLLVSNATFTTTGGSSPEVGGTNTHIVVKGTHPLIKRGSQYPTFYAKDDTSIDFYLPVGQTDYDEPVFQFNSLCLEAGCSFNFPNIVEFQKSLAQDTEVRLASRNGNGAFFYNGIPQSVWDETNAKLPAGCYIHRSADEYQLLLHVKPIRGLAIIIK